MKVIFTVVLVIFVLYLIGLLFSPKHRTVRYKNTNSIRVRDSSGVKIIQSYGDDEIDLEVNGNSSVIINGDEIEIPRRIRHGYDNAIVHIANNVIYVNGHRYNKYTGLFSNEQEYEL